MDNGLCPLLRAGEISAMMMAGQCTPHFLFSVAPKRENGPCTVQKRKGAGAEFGRRGQIRPNYGGWSEPVPIKLANLLPGALDSVPCGGALPHLRLPARVFCFFDARPLASLPALRACPGTCGIFEGNTSLPENQFHVLPTCLGKYQCNLPSFSSRN